MPPAFPLIFIVMVIVFISTHAASTPPKKKKEKTPTEDLAKAFDKVIKASNEAMSGRKGK